jgi:2-keto-4-pentenoate hydratase/2-oxohepta-3-ene-1,7-dioic acid hydratase in catechol pathway
VRLANLIVRAEGSDAAAELPCVADPDRGWVPLVGLAPGIPADLPGLIATGLGPEVRSALLASATSAPSDAVVPFGTARLAAPFRRPRMLWGIGLNYLDHARDLDAPHPTEPASFIKGDHTIIGPGDEILLPPQSLRVTAEAELALVIGRTAWQVDVADALDHVAAVLCVLDQTAEDILQRNPRFLTRSKNFPTFLSLGGELVTLDEVRSPTTGLGHLRVGTWHNGALHREAAVDGMAFDPATLVAFHSRVFPLQPGDVILTGTPGAVVIEDGDVVECRIEGVGAVRNPVRRA